MIIATLPLAGLLVWQILQSMGAVGEADPLFAKNILWWFGHPVVYLLLFPAAAAYYWLVPRYAGRELVAGNVIAIAWTIAVIANVFVWAHHIYLDYPEDSVQARINTVMQPITFALVLPSALSLYSLGFTIYRSSFRWTPASTALFFGLVGWLLAGLSGIVNATIAFDVIVHNTLWVVGHFHHMAMLNIGLLVFGADVRPAPGADGQGARQRAGRLDPRLDDVRRRHDRLRHLARAGPRRRPAAVLRAARALRHPHAGVTAVRLRARRRPAALLLERLRDAAREGRGCGLRRARDPDRGDASPVHVGNGLRRGGSRARRALPRRRRCRDGVRHRSGDGRGPHCLRHGHRPDRDRRDGGEADAAAGEQVYADAGCGSCHTLAEAGSSGTVGPSLDARPVTAALVANRVTNGRGAMPSFEDRLSDEQIQDVAAYVADASGP